MRRLSCAVASLAVTTFLAACAPPPPVRNDAGPADGAHGTGITFFGDARLGVAYGPDPRDGKTRTRIVAE